ncbi:hypothetical protein [Planosporangium mesophilum]|uniref:DNA primase n=1 Tax=Planosporangium mesophilum TaxID=689768 RepID=A0A8J3WXR7_9ACTN|nr:hypothetical protein [Planosporangium mesophilum]NJC81814.1 hypothetical protein [Planosporangium mesophilum]GII20525.1 hypothetical protein Pme01_01220 [Planosporangium mesophilum]
MKDSVKLGAAVVGGYLLGRTKKGKAAIGLALWLSGKRMDNTRDALMRLVTSPELAKITGQVRGPLLAAAGRAVTATIESRTNALADSLQQRTSQLLPAVGATADDRRDERADAGLDDEGRDDEGRDDEGRDDEGRDDDARLDDAEPDEPEPPRKAGRPAKAARRAPARRPADEGREPARSRESGRSREPGRRRSAQRGGEVA